jgi:AraC-like DNA-binding protein
MHVEQHETDTAAWELARHEASPPLRPYLGRAMEGWAQTRGIAPHLREVPFPGVPVVLNLASPWIVGERHLESFVAGLSTSPSIVQGREQWSCVELRLTPLGAHRLLGVAMFDLADESVELEQVVPGANELEERLREAPAWTNRFDLIERFFLRRLADSRPPDPGVEWSWNKLRATRGRAPIRGLVEELGWSHRRLVNRFREQVGLSPKRVARVIRFDHAVTALRTGGELVEIAYECGYADQAHLNREFGELAGTTPTALRAAGLESGGLAA